jgi:hypothetical protein
LKFEKLAIKVFGNSKNKSSTNLPPIPNSKQQNGRNRTTKKSLEKAEAKKKLDREKLIDLEKVFHSLNLSDRTISCA